MSLGHPVYCIFIIIAWTDEDTSYLLHAGKYNPNITNDEIIYRIPKGRRGQCCKTLYNCDKIKAIRESMESERARRPRKQWWGMLVLEQQATADYRRGNAYSEEEGRANVTTAESQIEGMAGCQQENKQQGHWLEKGGSR